MKKFLYLLLATTGLSYGAQAASGDTTWVQAQYDKWLGTVPTNTDTTITFPDGTKSYQKILMIFTLGKYACPGAPQYCADWDYTVLNYLMTPNGDTVELGRLITPYANSNRLTSNWKGDYIYDVTDYYPLLKNSATVRTSFSGWSGGFTGNIRFAFIEGTPPRNVLGVSRAWGGSYKFGDGADPIDNNLTAVNKTAPSGTESAELKLILTGHGADGTGCAEFCKKYYQVKVNGNMIEQKDIWRADCGVNEIYPQNGTWVFDRGNWCPGAAVQTNSHVLGGVTAGNGYSVDLDFESYTGSGSLGSYSIDASVVYYGTFNKILDAAMEDVIAPSKSEFHFRENPTHKPIVRVKNTGSTTINSVRIQYATNTDNNDYTWNGSINPLQAADIELPELWSMRVDTAKNRPFTATIVAVNGQADNDASNNTIKSTFDPVPLWPLKIVVLFKNNTPSSNISETSYTITDAGGGVVFQRINNTVGTTYRDTITLPLGIYKLEVKDDACDGLNWWYTKQTGQGDGGSFQVYKATGGTLAVKGNYSGDFGCGFTQYFNVGFPTGITDVNEEAKKSMDVYPNPANDIVNIDINGINTVKGQIALVDAVGRVVLQQATNSSSNVINTSALANGVYSVIYIDDQQVQQKLQARLVITK